MTSLTEGSPISMSYVLSYDQQDFLQDGGVFESFTHKMAAWEICLRDGGVSESFAHKMAATNKT